METEKPKIVKKKLTDGREFYMVKIGSVEINVFSKTHLFVIGAISKNSGCCSTELEPVW